ncbi:MAG TPA: HAD family hydrolase [Blastocatellia bacterium]|nr:HAD family hydrolase [Blastocatellia bacterium]
MLKIRAISFDFWNTLFKEQPGAFRLYKAKRRSLLSKAICDYRKVSDLELDEACRVERESHERIWQEQHRTPLASHRLSRILSELEVVLPDAATTQLVTSMEEIILEQPPLLVDGAREVLVSLSGGYRLGVISDVGFSPGRVLKQLLADHGLIHLFDSLVFSDEAGVAKPHVEVFERTARSLSAEPQTIVHIGDLERTDIVGAKKAGYRAIRFTGVTAMNEDETTIADFVTDDLTEVPRLVECLD